MTSRRYLALAATLVFSAACNDSRRGVTITGNFGGAHARNGVMERLISFVVPSAYALVPGDVRRVMVFNGSGGFSVSDVSNGTFSVNVDPGGPVGLVFVGDNNSYKGYLSLGDGLESLPLQALSNGEATVDLQALSSRGDIVEPSSNPIGGVIPLTAAEQRILAQANTWFAMLVKNPDVDRNGQIDLLEGKFYRLSITYYFRAGNFPSPALSPTLSGPAAILASAAYNLKFQLQPGTEQTPPSSLHYLGPAGSGLDCQGSLMGGGGDQSSNYVSCPVDLGGTPLVSGEYAVSYGGKTLTFQVPSQANAFDDIVVPVPSILLNPNGTVHSVSWVYKTSSGEVLARPQNLIRRMLWFLESEPGVNAYFAEVQVSGNEHTLSNQSIPWSTVRNNVAFMYDDFYGNQFHVGFTIGQ